MLSSIGGRVDGYCAGGVFHLAHHTPPGAVRNYGWTRRLISVMARALTLGGKSGQVLLVTPFFAALLYWILDWKVAVTAVCGVLTSLLASYIGMSVSVRTNLQTADIANEGKQSPFRVALFGGSVMGFCITGLSLIVLSVLFSIFKDPNALVGFAFGGGLAALFAQIGGGIFTKSADIGADLVGKIEENIPEDDPRNAAVIADLVGDNVGDCAGRGADLFQTFSDDLVTGSIVAVALASVYGQNGYLLPIP